MLSAAIAAGFRESGLQSLKALTCPDALPMVAVRTAGLSLSSVVACVDHHANNEQIETLVDESYLGILVHEANERFRANAQRIRRFEEALMSKMKQQKVDGTTSRKTNGNRGPKGGLRRGRFDDSKQHDRNGRRLSDSLEDSLGIFDSA